jgi:hypothetical protein
VVVYAAVSSVASTRAQIPAPPYMQTVFVFIYSVNSRSLFFGKSVMHCCHSLIQMDLAIEERKARYGKGSLSKMRVKPEKK